MSDYFWPSSAGDKREYEFITLAELRTLGGGYQVGDVLCWSGAVWRRRPEFVGLDPVASSVRGLS